MKTCACGCGRALRSDNKSGWRAACRGKSPEQKAYNKAYYQANSEKAKAKGKAWYEANPEKAKENARAWAAANPEKVKEQNMAPCCSSCNLRKGAKDLEVFLLELDGAA